MSSGGGKSHGSACVENGTLHSSVGSDRSAMPDAVSRCIFSRYDCSYFHVVFIAQNQLLLNFSLGVCFGSNLSEWAGIFIVSWKLHFFFLPSLSAATSLFSVVSLLSAWHTLWVLLHQHTSRLVINSELRYVKKRKAKPKVKALFQFSESESHERFSSLRVQSGTYRPACPI